MTSFFFALLVTNYLLVACSSIIVKVITMISNPPIITMGIRSTIGGLGLLVVAHFFRRGRKVFIFSDMPRELIKIGVFKSFLPSFLLYWAVQYVSAAKFTLFYNFCPFMTYILSYIFLDEKLTKKKVCGVLIGFMGIIPIIIARSSGNEMLLAELFKISLPEVALFISMTSLSYGCIEIKKIVTERPNINIWSLTAYDSLIGGSIALLVSSFFKEKYVISSMPHFIGAMVGMTIITTFIVGPLYTVLLKHFSATLLSVGGFSIPFFTALLGWLFLGETIGPELYFSTLFVIAGTLLFYQEERALSKKKKKLEDDGLQLPL
jgi:drug/metabolite transporter (DMT)-like permease